MPRDEAPEAPEIKADTVDALFEAVRDSLNAEDTREQSFNTRAGGLAGFVGVIVSITTAAGKIALDEDPSRVATVASAIAFAVAIIALLTSLIIAITKILIPQESAAISMSTVERYPTWEYIATDKTMVRGEILRGSITALAKDRQRNSSKATWLRRAYKALLVAVAALTAFGGILVIDAL
jgi:hypothetical protein